MGRLEAISCAAVLMMLASSNFGQAPKSLYEKVHQRAELPSGGEFVSHPKKDTVVFYYTNRHLMWADKSNTQKHSGLYISRDGGGTWRLLCYFFEFKKVFIHPETERLYAIIEYKWLDTDERGFLVPHIADKALESSDGKNWKDIMGKQKYVATLYDIFVDPDNPQRVCLKASVIRPVIMQSVDDIYTEWEWYRAWDWPDRLEIRGRKKQ